MRKLAHYYYSDGNEIAVFVQNRKIYIRDPKTAHCLYPASPITGDRTPHPGEGTEMADWDYETLGLYYDFAMAGVGWDGDC